VKDNLELTEVCDIQIRGKKLWWCSKQTGDDDDINDADKDGREMNDNEDSKSDDHDNAGTADIKENNNAQDERRSATSFSIPSADEIAAANDSRERRDSDFQY
jgi:hypothetical protein